MKAHAIVAAAGAVALLAAGTAVAGSKTDRATGGGQFLINTRGGAGDNIGFTAQGTADAAKGQVQYVDRTSTGQTTYHGTVDCLVVVGKEAHIAGTWRDGTFFHLFVSDNGHHGADMIQMDPNASDNQCNFRSRPSDRSSLARGNVTVYDASMNSNGHRSATPTSSPTSALRLALR